ncbi:hypothetical protein [Streptomyces sp. NPDC012466]|uniref:hypothetical protein n=1 Tax=Streptomyces sp. NPDC012466 TaxID=3364835 RepID=UPI0036E3D9C3
MDTGDRKDFQDVRAGVPEDVAQSSRPVLLMLLPEAGGGVGGGRDVVDQDGRALAARLRVEDHRPGREQRRSDDQALPERVGSLPFLFVVHLEQGRVPADGGMQLVEEAFHTAGALPCHGRPIDTVAPTHSE